MKKLSIPMTKAELILGWIYFALQLLVLPSALVIVNLFLGQPLSMATLNMILYCLNFLCVTVIFRKFLWHSLRLSMEAPFRCLRFAFIGLVLYFLASTLISIFVVAVRPDFANINDQTIMDMVTENYTPMAVCTVFLVPVVEESFFRGLIFRGFYNKSRVLAYCVSTLAFAAIHVIPYLGTYDLGLLGLCLLQYLPAGLFLGWAYAKADSIFAPILMHITINQIAMSAMR